MASTNRFARAALVIGALSLGLMLAGCETFDPTDIFSSDLFDTKKKLPGERKPVFPEGTPGVPQGVPPDLVRGYQPPEPPPQAAVEPEKPKAKPKPKPKVVAKPAESTPTASSTPTAVTVRPSAPQGGATGGASQWPDPPQAQTQQQQQQSGGGWSGSQGAVESRWPDPPTR